MRVIAIVGATGAVGREFEQILQQRGFGQAEYRLFASERSAGSEVIWCGRAHRVGLLAEGCFSGADIAFFSAGAFVSREHAPHAAADGAVVIDNSSAFRMEPGTPLVVPEVNAHAIREHRGMIANPNCSTIILAVVLAPLHRATPVRRVVVSTYQAASGAGARALEELEQQTRAVLAGQRPEPRVFPVPCAFNVFSHNSQVGPDGYNVEERKMIEETQKILGAPQLAIAPTCMRVPVMRAHTESVSIEFSKPVAAEQVRQILERAPGVRIVDDPQRHHFPMPIEASGQDDVLVGRIRADLSVPGGHGVQLICCGDQLRKGAALNAVQIAEHLSR